jgi:hypothetical protein
MNTTPHHLFKQYKPNMIVLDEKYMDIMFDHIKYDPNKKISTFVDIYGRKNKKIACLRLKIT